MIWYDHDMRRPKNYIRRKSLYISVRAKLPICLREQWLDVVKQDSQYAYRLSTEDVEDRAKWSS